MRVNRYIASLTGVLLLVCLFQSCTGGKKKLDREKATTLITQAFDLPFSEGKDIRAGKFKTENWSRGNCDIGERYPGEKMLVEEGYREVSGYSVHSGQLSFMDCIYTIQFTPKALPFISTFQTPEGTINNVKVSEVTFGYLKTLREVNEKEYEVEFSFNRTLTPFGMAYNKGIAGHYGVYIKQIETDALANLKAKILLYDDGWRIATEDYEKVKGKLIFPTGSSN